jgi:hypothetical protein
MTTSNSPASRLAGHVLVEALIAQGADTVFGVPGESYLAMLDGFHEHRDQIRFIACRQEGGQVFQRPFFLPPGTPNTTFDACGWSSKVAENC